MRIAVLSYPMLFQRKGGLQIQILETISALNDLGVQAMLMNTNTDRLEDFDLIHVFSAINGNYRILEAAKGVARPIVISPLIQPDWTSFAGIRERFLDKFVGKLSNWHIHTTYHEISACLQLSDAIIALGEVEKFSIINAFLTSPDKISVIPNGIPRRFFNAESDLFCKYFSIKKGFVLCVAAINSHKNQLALIEALKDTGLRVVLIGQCLETDRAYLSELLNYSNVTYLGVMEYNDPLLASAYAAASVFCLPSYSEVMPLCVLESLAAGTPVVMTRNHCMDVSSMRECVLEIDPDDRNSIYNAVNELNNRRIEQSISQNYVNELSWSNVAEKVYHTYESVLSKRGC